MGGAAELLQLLPIPLQRFLLGMVVLLLRGVVAGVVGVLVQVLMGLRLLLGVCLR